MTLCACGCEQELPPSRNKNRRFVQFHHLRRKDQPRGRFPGGSRHPDWNGGTSTSDGYRSVLDPQHTRANAYGYVREHIKIAEEALGKQLPLAAVIHHWDQNRSNNANSNLLICQDQAYHRLIHRRMSAKKKCGNANWLNCCFCHQHDDPSRLVSLVSNGKQRSYHQTCNTEYARQFRERRAAAGL